MRTFKSAASRLARVFHAGREKWKAKALARQKELRAAQVRIRDLEASRERWKARAHEAEEQLGQGKGRGGGSPEEGPPGQELVVHGARETVHEGVWLPAPGHV